jgi:hypothetical protein
VHYIDSTRLGEIISAHVTVTDEAAPASGRHTRPHHGACNCRTQGVFERFTTTEEASNFPE